MFHSVGGKTCVSQNLIPPFPHFRVGSGQVRTVATRIIGNIGQTKSDKRVPSLWVNWGYIAGSMDAILPSLRDSIKGATYKCLFQSSNEMVLLTAHSAVVAVPNVAKISKSTSHHFPSTGGRTLAVRSRLGN
ncbi:hypothetical protein FVEG_14681 [Fusarium verticillioides 7600]|uniref:Uncharacterized protein n=1 Tax=Gibberella moniliformis (strain M3125 / FGSC 7600) TaxID=334819 RepID=W7LD29_GIBM7|nr:hypothetical protein FVEG_14681 [Fusarium verticillioides 7600]XP_018742684.1 hypothetical protein FVEG_14681 [Fusarium verticillioides 7600]XP_018742685.1 hypothetical protein FVEG_14681 [Fusarium verticillioides 7600]XP_018742686.1 hypothetical protein FVEG_14681 [Fusarium verticillioides 7600]XP_018742687.1 hypothetical protein FVEG_14681 [Fusarium verticillioides 7600]XP_018742688.1 hypothetical protein FVEG_14681 [Fusarium verticillioides 7600]XP_018742689.1 hypothetical protein FVEG_